MAATAITPVKLSRNTFNAYPTTSALDASDGGLIAWTGADERMLVIVENTDATNAETVTVKAGDGIQAAGDLSVSVAASAKKLLVLESGRYLITSGASKGKVKVTGSADVKVAAAIL